MSAPGKKSMAPQVTSVDESIRLSGTVQKYNAKRGFGFITPADGSTNVFVLWDQIQSPDKWPRLEDGMAVEFFRGTVKNGQACACQVTGEGSKPISVEDGQDTRILSEERIPGTVKFFARGGYGFITTEKDIAWPIETPAGSDIYVSREEIAADIESACSLAKGMKVEFNVFRPSGDKETLAAANVTAPGGDLLVFERPAGKGKGKGKGKSMDKGGWQQGKGGCWGGGKDWYGGCKGNWKGQKGWGCYPGVQRTIQKPFVVGGVQAWGKGGAKGGKDAGKAQKGWGVACAAKGGDAKGKAKGKGKY